VITATVKDQLARAELTADGNYTIPFSVYDLDTGVKDLNVTVTASEVEGHATHDDLTAAVRFVSVRTDGSALYDLRLSNVEHKGENGYKVALTITATDNIGQSHSRTILFDFVTNVPSQLLPRGSTIQTQTVVRNDRYRITGIPAYRNNINNFRPTTLTLKVKAMRDSSAFYIRTLFTKRYGSSSHCYVDIWRSVAGGAFKSVAQAMAPSGTGSSDANADGLLSMYGSEWSGGEHFSDPWAVDTPGAKKGQTVEYKVYVGVWSGTSYVDWGSYSYTNPNGRSPEVMTVSEIVAENDPCEGCVSPDEMVDGSHVQLAYKWTNVRTRISTPHYNNNANNFRATPISVKLTTKRDNSFIMVRAQFVIKSGTCSHNYVDIWRSINGGGFQSLAQTLANDCDECGGGSGDGNADGLVSNHGQGCEDRNGEHPRHEFAIDHPDVAKGTTIEYKVYVGTWGSAYIDLGSHDTGNPNGRSPEIIIAREIANGKVSGKNQREPSMFPVGTDVGVAYAWSNYRYRINSIPHYGNNINNFRPTKATISYTTKRDNSDIFIEAQFVFRPGSNSHNYVDIWRRVNGQGNWVSLAQSIAPNGSSDPQRNADGLISQHPRGSEASSGEHARHPWIVDKPMQKAGTKVEYRVYVGLWSSSYIDLGSHDRGNPNGRSPELLYLREIAQEEDDE
jgi:hypothetical protein